MSNKVVVHFLNKKLEKGYTYDFNTGKDIIHVTTSNEKGEKSILEANLKSVKAIFFVKDFIGNKNYKENKSTEFKVIGAKKIKVEFSDGEIIVGSTVSYYPGKKEFFLIPADSESNNTRVYIPSNSLKNVEIIT